MSFDLTICNGIIISSHNCYDPISGSLGIRHGVIEYIGEKNLKPSDSKKRIDASGKIVMPGLVNGHCHGDMTLAKGLGDDLTLQEQIHLFNPINWFSDILTIEDFYASRQLTYIEALLSGTTFILENAFWSLGDKSIDAFNSVGIKGGLVEDIVLDFKDITKKISSERIDEFQKETEKHNLIPVLGGILEENYESDILSYQKQIIDQKKCLWTSHLSETPWRKKHLMDGFNASSVQILEDYKMINNKYIGSHGIYLSIDDMKILKNHNAKIVNTPLCEMKLADGIAPIPELIKMGVVVGLGTDGALWNNSNDLFREMKGMALLHTINKGIRTIKATDVFDMATINGARLFGLENEIGSLEPGKKADIILVNANQPHMTPLRTRYSQNVISNLVFCATGQDVSHVIIDGNLVVENRRLLTIDINDVLEKVNCSSEKIGKYLEEVKIQQ